MFGAFGIGYPPAPAVPSTAPSSSAATPGGRRGRRISSGITTCRYRGQVYALVDYGEDRRGDMGRTA